VKTEDSNFFLTFLAVLGALVAIALLAGALASVMSSSDDGIDPRAAAVVEGRIAPTGQVAVGEPPSAAAEEAVNAVAAAPRSGQEVVDTVCAGCHAIGVAGAPKLGDNAAWASVSAKGFDAVLANAINGIRGMPPRGGSDATDDELRGAVMVMLKQAGL
jgi:cytochrome c5